ncbi:MAG: Mycobacterial persistence regulator A [Candidatus Accumulibacter regalis]|jgi:CheY-like chemotaxis protein|uniref:Mycobacterial persistence regulator A n=1 Tax=Accumulibacter regalis TaxID=522306 RepID=A0A011QIL6_ACCRE|nr:response regulator [Accumulibacter sp.]EXI89187.1 MAG: Mycobacterial persistence regulator A [Candidatus Accumulibacter regalis]MQM34197.1 response regulator [Candidatus Accumulibacter phosphatis]HRE71506.1 response regulator [Accumulibacter sp.]HRE85363.1 response regulator [Accumulibacter sp.]
MTAGVVLVIDDDRAVRDAFELALADDGYEVQLADSGQIGLQLAAARRPDLVFLDLKMPGLDGVETLRRLQATDATIPVYVATAFAQEYMEGLRRAQQAGLRFQLAAKPLSPKQIRIIVKSIINGD